MSDSEQVENVFIVCRRENRSTRHEFEGSFMDRGPHEVWRCLSCGARRVWGAARTEPRTSPVREWCWVSPQPKTLSAGQVSR